MNENILKTAYSRNVFNQESPLGSGKYIIFNSSDDISSNIELQTALTLHEDAWKQIIAWNEQWIKTYKPGSNKAKAIAPLIKEMPYEDERSEIENDTERYAAWFKKLFNDGHLFLKLPGGQPGGKIIFKWNNSPRDRHGGQYNGAVTWQSYYGVAVMIIDPIYWFNANEERRRDLLLHELEHVMDLFIGESSPESGVQGEWGDFGSEKQSQIGHYKATFSKHNFPDWLKARHMLGETPFPNIEWAKDEREQRSELKKFLDHKNGVMTPEILAELDREKKGVRKEKTSIDAMISNKDSRQAWSDYIDDFASRVGIKLAVLMYMKTDDPSIISHINQIALLGEPVQPSFTEEQSAYACKLDSLHKWLTKQGHSEEAASLDDMIQI
jgi:hypothetical protein